MPKKPAKPSKPTAAPKKPLRRPNPPPAVKLGPTGRPTLYQPEFDEIVYRLGLLGLTDGELAGFFGVDETTIANWEKAHPEFLRSRARAREDADGKVARAQYHAAIGYRHEDVHISSYEGEITVTPVMKYYPPNVQAGQWWLKNRHPDKWKDKFDIANSGTVVIGVINYADQDDKA
jgi:hypothetical protein